MGTLHERLIGAGLAGFAATRLHGALAPLTRGRGAILAFHHVRPFTPRSFALNRGLEITPEHLDAVLAHLRRDGYSIVPLDDLVAQLRAQGHERLVALTFDDGYRDNLRHALPVLERHNAPFTLFVTTGYAERRARLWWRELEAAIGRTEVLRVELDGRTTTMPVRSPAQKGRAFAHLARRLRGADPASVAAVLDALECDGAAGLSEVAALCLDWDGIVRLAAHPLVTLGCHTLTHPCLAALTPTDMRHEMAEARDIIAARIGRPVHHLAYPYGGASAAGAREFAAAAALGFTSAVTTRPGVLYAGHAGRLTALPRLSVNGLWPSLEVLDILLSGAPTWLHDRVVRSR